MDNKILHKALDFLQEIGTIMYVGGILSHIVIGIIFADSDARTVHSVYVYKEQSAYILILPGLALKILTDLALYFTSSPKPNWLKLKFIPVAFLTINAFFFLVPMMPDLVSLAIDSAASGELSQEFIDMEHKEQFIGQLNILPLLLELWLGSYRPIINWKKNKGA